MLAVEVTTTRGVRRGVKPPQVSQVRTHINGIAWEVSQILPLDHFHELYRQAGRRSTKQIGPMRRNALAEPRQSRIIVVVGFARILINFRCWIEFLRIQPQSGPASARGRGHPASAPDTQCRGVFGRVGGAAPYNLPPTLQPQINSSSCIVHTWHLLRPSSYP